MAANTNRKLRVALSEGLASWLTFERHVGRDDVLSERYLTLPIAQILRSHVDEKVAAEHNHPILAIAGKIGRPPQLDFAIETDVGISLVVETKWANEGGVSVTDVVWDCVQLELAAQHYGCDAIFILAGMRKQVNKVLASAPFNPRTSRRKPSPILGFKGVGRWSLRIKSPRRDFGPPLHEILSRSQVSNGLNRLRAGTVRKFLERLLHPSPPRWSRTSLRRHPQRNELSE